MARQYVPAAVSAAALACATLVLHARRRAAAAGRPAAVGGVEDFTVAATHSPFGITPPRRHGFERWWPDDAPADDLVPVK